MCVILNPKPFSALGIGNPCDLFKIWNLEFLRFLKQATWIPDVGARKRFRLDDDSLFMLFKSPMSSLFT
jgi:hypothetical protein